MAALDMYMVHTLPTLYSYEIFPSNYLSPWLLKIKLAFPETALFIFINQTKPLTTKILQKRTRHPGSDRPFVIRLSTQPEKLYSANYLLHHAWSEERRLKYFQSIGPLGRCFL